jgi:hypothetical protein
MAYSYPDWTNHKQDLTRALDRRLRYPSTLAIAKKGMIRVMLTDKLQRLLDLFLRIVLPA